MLATLAVSLLCLPAALAAAAGADVAPGAVGEPAAVRGVHYRPGASVGGSGGDDLLSESGVAFWGGAGRGDLRTMRQLGANMVVVDGIDPDADHSAFLDLAERTGLGVALSLDSSSDAFGSGECVHPFFDCFAQVSQAFERGLRSGGLLAIDGTYHPALRYIDIFVRPALSDPADASATVHGVISALDAILDAEQKAGILEPSVNFTASVAYTACPTCAEFQQAPALGLLAEIERAMKSPGSYQYSPRHDLAAAFAQRFTNSFSTDATVGDLQVDFLQHYVNRFPSTPVFVSEYKSSVIQNFVDVLSLTEGASPLFLGVSIAQFAAQEESEPALFGYGSTVLASVDRSSGATEDVLCLEPRLDPMTAVPALDAVVAAFRGRGLDAASLCGTNPWSLPLTQESLTLIAESDNFAYFKVLIFRIIEHLGASITLEGVPTFEYFAQKYMSMGGNIYSTVAELRARPNWLEFDRQAECIADRNAEPALVAKTIEWMCEHANEIDCGGIPEECTGSIYHRGDYVFSRYYREIRGYINPLVSCYSDGAAVYATSRTWMRNGFARRCVAGDGEERSEPEALPEGAPDFFDFDFGFEAAAAAAVPSGAAASYDLTGAAESRSSSRAYDIPTDTAEDSPATTTVHLAANEAENGHFLASRAAAPRRPAGAVAGLLALWPLAALALRGRSLP